MTDRQTGPAAREEALVGRPQADSDASRWPDDDGSISPALERFRHASEWQADWNRRMFEAPEEVKAFYGDFVNIVAHFPIDMQARAIVSAVRKRRLANDAAPLDLLDDELCDAAEAFAEEGTAANTSRPEGSWRFIVADALLAGFKHGAVWADKRARKPSTQGTGAEAPAEAKPTLSQPVPASPETTEREGEALGSQPQAASSTSGSQASTAPEVDTSACED